MLLPPAPAPLSVSAVLKVIVPTGEALWNCRNCRAMRPAPTLRLCAPRVLVTAAAELQRVVDRDQRDEGRVAEAGNPAGFIGVSPDVTSSTFTFGDAELLAEVRAVVERQRLDVALHVADLDFGHQRRAEDPHVVGLHAVRLGRVRSRKRAAVAARLDAVHGRQRAGRERVDVVVGVAREQRVAVVEPVIDRGSRPSSCPACARRCR